MGDVWAWSNGYGTGAVDDARTHPAASPELFGSLAELDRPGKTADSIRLTMSKALTWLAIPDIRAMVTGPDARPFDAGAFTDNRGTIYMLAPGGTAPRARRCSAASPPTCTAPPATTAWPGRTAGSTPGCCSRSMSCTCAPSTCPPGWPTPPGKASRSPP